MEVPDSMTDEMGLMNYGQLAGKRLSTYSHSGERILCQIVRNSDLGITASAGILLSL